MLNKHKCSSTMMGWQCTTADCQEIIVEKTDSPIEILQHFFACFFLGFLFVGIPFILWMTAFESALQCRFILPSMLTIIGAGYGCATMAFIYINEHIIGGTLTYTISLGELQERADLSDVCIAFPEFPFLIF